MERRIGIGSRREHDSERPTTAAHLYEPESFLCVYVSHNRRAKGNKASKMFCSVSRQCFISFLKGKTTDVRM